MVNICLLLLLILLVLAIAAKNLLGEEIHEYYGDLGAGQDFSLPQLGLFIAQWLGIHPLLRLKGPRNEVIRVKYREIRVWSIALGIISFVRIVTRTTTRV